MSRSVPIFSRDRQPRPTIALVRTDTGRYGAYATGRLRPILRPAPDPRMRVTRRTSLALLFIILPVAGRAEEPTDANRTGLFPRDFSFSALAVNLPSSSLRSNRIPLFRIAPGFLTEQVG